MIVPDSEVFNRRWYIWTFFEKVANRCLKGMICLGAFLLDIPFGKVDCRGRTAMVAEFEDKSSRL